MPASPTRKALEAGVAGGVIGALGGAAIGDRTPGLRWRRGALLGATLVGLGEAITDATRARGSLKPLPWRIASSSMPAAVAGWTLARAIPRLPPAPLGAIVGAAGGALGLRREKVLLGAATGALIGAVAGRRVGPGLVAAGASIGARLASVAVLRDDPRLTILGERVPSAQVPEVVPYAARRRYVGGDYLKDLADELGGRHERDPLDVGIIASLDELAGPTFDPGLVHPLIREFYEHTARFSLSIVPEWRWWMRPPYLLYRTLLARPLGQANLPFNQRDAERGMRSIIDTIEIDGSGRADLRGWIRVFEDSGEPIYVGIYTTYRSEGVGYVSVGFPLPDANFTATLVPSNHGRHDLVLRSDSERTATGHYLSALEGTRESLSVLKLMPFGEEIVVHVRDGKLGADHRFSLGSTSFLTLRYSMEHRGAR